MKIAYLDCFSGISGDMFLGALIDVGLPLDKLRKALSSIPFEGYEIEAVKAEKNYISGTQFSVKVDGEVQTHRKMNDIKKLIDKGDLKKEIKNKSISIFESIANEEGQIHGYPPEEVHFHEVGAVDSIIDIVGTVFGLDYLGINALHTSALPLGSGFTKSAHGIIPIPAPATVALLRGVPVYDSGLKYEMVTPTGAALVQELVGSFEGIPPMTIAKVGYGAGTRDLPDRPNLLRVIIGEDGEKYNTETVSLLEANLDDSNPEWLGFIMDQLFKAGALDVLFYPIQMKKNRPGTMIQIICDPQLKDDLMNILFKESTTLGIRYRNSQRRVLGRSSIELNSPWGKIKVKQIIHPNEEYVFQPEYEDCKRVAEEQGIALREIYSWVMSQNTKY